MTFKKIFFALVIAVAAASQSPVINAQSSAQQTDSGWATIARNAQAKPGAQERETVQDVPAQSRAAIEPQDVDPKKKIVGSWLMRVSPVGGPGFESLQTYNDDGTMTETSSVLAQLTIGPAHGAWDGKKNDYTVTFELFVFNPLGESVGRLRVRAGIHLTGDDTLTAEGTLDLIQPDGTVIPNIGSTPFTGTRIKVVSPN